MVLLYRIRFHHCQLPAILRYNSAPSKSRVSTNTALLYQRVPRRANLSMRALMHALIPYIYSKRAHTRAMSGREQSKIVETAKASRQSVVICLFLGKKWDQIPSFGDFHCLSSPPRIRIGLGCKRDKVRGYEGTRVQRKNKAEFEPLVACVVHVCMILGRDLSVGLSLFLLEWNARIIHTHLHLKSLSSYCILDVPLCF